MNTTTSSALVPAAEGNPLRGRFNAWFFRVMDETMHRLLGDRKQRLFARLPSSVVELGPGTGANFRYYRPSTQVIGIEPNPYMHDTLREHAKRRGMELELVAASAHDTGLADQSVDAVVCTLVLCTVEDPEAVVAEVRRILRPGGRFIFVEHVAAAPGTPLAGLQKMVRHPWCWCFEGCQVTRDTQEVIESANFRSTEIEQYRLRSIFLPFNPQIAGVAIA